MPENAQFSFWKNDRSSLADEIRESFPDPAAQEFIREKLKEYRALTIEQLLSSKKLDKINGTRGPALYELKIKGRRAEARFIAVRESHTGVRLLLIFKGSGSGGAVERWLSKAKARV